MSWAFRHSFRLGARFVSLKTPQITRSLTLPSPSLSRTINRPSLFFCRNMSDKSRDIDIVKLKEYQNDPEVLIVDVREKNEIAETGVLPGGINIPLGELEAALNKSPEDFKKAYNHEKPSKDTKIVFSCRSGKRSLNALGKALSLGYKESENFAGGWLEWEKHSKQ